MKRVATKELYVISNRACHHLFYSWGTFWSDLNCFTRYQKILGIYHEFKTLIP